MARLKNTAFSGAAMHEVEPGVASLRRVLKEAIEDTALIYDKVTGENSETNTIIHDGTAGRGCLLGIPMASQSIGRSLEVTTGTTGTIAIVPVPVFLAAGETAAVVEVFLDGEVNLLGSTGMRLVFRDTSWNIDADVGFDRAAPGHYAAAATGLTAGLNLMFVQYDVTEFRGGVFVGWRMHHARLRSDGGGDARRNSASDSTPNPYAITRTASVGMAHTDFDASLLADGYPYHGYLTALLNRNQNALDEYGSGWPVGGNATYTQADNSAGVADDVNPGVSQFFAHTRSYFSSEPLVDFPVCVVAMGSCGSDGAFSVNVAEPPTTGMTGWYAPWPLVITPSSATRVRFTLPDFPTGTSNLKAAILCCGNVSGDAEDWTGGVTTTAGSATDAFSAITGSSDGFYLSEPTAIPFTADAEQTIEITFSRSGASKAKVDEIALCGFCLYFEP